MTDLKQNYVNTISDLYPADSDFADTAKIGQNLLMKAIFRNWSSLPEEILRDYAHSCELMERNKAYRTYYDQSEEDIR